MALHKFMDGTLCRRKRIEALQRETGDDWNQNDRQNTGNTNTERAHSAFYFTKLQRLGGAHCVSGSAQGKPAGNRMRDVKNFKDHFCDHISQNTGKQYFKPVPFNL